MRSLICAVGLLCCWTAKAVEQTGVPPVANPQTAKECQDLSDRWYEKRKGLEEASRVCERRDGGSVRAAGVYMPNCNARQQAYVTCASITDRLCWVDNRRQEAVSTCHRDLAANQRAAQDRSTAAAKLNSEMQKLSEARANSELLFNSGPAAVLLQNYVTTPQRAGERFNEAMKEAARTTGTRAPDSQPELNRSGTMSDALHRAVTPSPAVAEIGSQSGGAARARMGDALNMLDGVQSHAASEGIDTGISRPLTPRSIPQVVQSTPTARISQDDDEESTAAASQRAATNLELMRQLNQSMQSVIDASRARLQGAARPTGQPTSPPVASARRCRYRDVVGAGVDLSLPYCY